MQTRIKLLIVTTAAIMLAALIAAYQPAHASGPWYVAPGGSDGNDCASPATACASVNGALAKPSFVPGDTIFMASGAYTGTGSEVVLLNLAAVLSGGWDPAFAVQNGSSILDGQGVRRGLTANSSSGVSVNHITAQNGTGSRGGGVWNTGVLVLSHSVIISNTAGDGGGIYNQGMLTVDAVDVEANHATGYSGGGIGSYGRLVVTGSRIAGNTGVYGGGIASQGLFTLTGSTVANNSANYGGGIDASYSNIWLNNSTLSGNYAFSGPALHVTVISATLSSVTVRDNKGVFGAAAIYVEPTSPPSGGIVARNSIIAGNGGNPDCYGNFVSAGYNLIGSTSGCSLVAASGDQTNVDAMMGPLVGWPGYHPLLAGSPAINAGNPTGCNDGAGSPLPADERGAPRVTRCDIGAYEYTAPGAPVGLFVLSGTPQRSAPGTTFVMPLEVAVLDALGSPVPGVGALFTAPASAASASFSSTGSYTSTAIAAADGGATSPALTAGLAPGGYVVTASVSGIVTPALFALTNIGWYVKAAGNDSQDCQSVATACATIGAALTKAAFVPGDTVLVSAETFTPTINITTDTRLLGGWDTAFLSPTATTLIQPQAAAGMVLNGVNVIVQSFTLRGAGVDQHGGSLVLNQSAILDSPWFGIHNSGGRLELNDSTIAASALGGISTEFSRVFVARSLLKANSATNGGGIATDQTDLTLDHSMIDGSLSGGGISAGTGHVTLNSSAVVRNAGGDGIRASVGGGSLIVAINNSTVSGNAGAGVYAYEQLLPYFTVTVSINSSTIAGNGGSGVQNVAAGIILRDSLLSHNSAGSAGSDCTGAIGSAGYNLLTNAAGCAFAAAAGDLTNVDASLFPIIGSPGYQPLERGSRAIDAGNPAGCADGAGNPLLADERSAPRIGRCDIGAYEYDPNHDVLSYSMLPSVMRDYCASYADNFSNPGSGWFVTNTLTDTFAYNGGEYQIVGKRPGLIYTARAPQCDRQNYVVQADARWAGTVNNYYSLLFGVTPALDQYYVFEVNPGLQTYRLRRRDTDGVIRTVIDATTSMAIQAGLASNHLKVTRNGASIALDVNGTLLTTVSDGTIGGMTGAGLAIRPYDNVLPGDARFDNFSVSALPAAVAAVPGSSSGTEPSARRPFGANRDPEPELAPTK